MELLTYLQRLLVRICQRGNAYGGCWLLILCCVFNTAKSFAEEPLEYAVKAAYLTKFGIYIEWPSTAFSTPDSAVNLCLVGNDPFGQTLDKAAANQRIGNRPILLKRLKTVNRESGCHILYIGSTDATYINQTIEALRGSGTLTVTDAELGAPGIINFVIQDNRVRFEVDGAAAGQNQLAVSSKLLSLALNVRAKR